MLCLTFCAAGEAQTRRRSARRSPRAAGGASAASSAAAQNAEIRAGAERVATQVQNLTRFIYLYGRISNGVEASEQMRRQGGANAGEAPQLEKTKTGMRDGVRNLRAGLIDLESYFETTPAVRRFYPQVVGISDSAAVAEQQVGAGQYDQAGRSLIAIVNKLSDALVQIR